MEIINNMKNPDSFLDDMWNQTIPADIIKNVKNSIKKSKNRSIIYFDIDLWKRSNI